MKSGHLYYASDKAVYDALLQYNFKNADMKELFLSRGILISPDTERDTSAMYFSRLNHDYYDHQKIAGIFGSDNRRERSTIAHLANTFSESKLEVVAQALKEKLEETGSEVKFVWVGKKMEIRIKYEDYNSNKSEFKQTVEREGVFEIESTDEGVSIRSPQNNFIDGAKSILVDLLAKNSGGSTIVVKEIEMRSIADNKLRTQFFRGLMQSLSGYVFKDVTDVYVFNPKISGGASSSDDIGIHITKASLKGEGLLSSPELSSLLKTGFYVCKVIWTTLAASEKSDIYELEAQFSDPEHCEKFSYAVRGRYKFNDKEFHNKNRTPCEATVEKKMLKLLESGAIAALEAVRKEFTGSGSDEVK
ncbi:hypothetical protein CCU68_07760 [Pseudomonas gingeri NCPPB 3146 = LMG 5327]|uniref:Uncharacterized protein n=2 Tax=Pseudomonas gingeri TaxID=117681 RepID=A0A7Y7XYM8_9PSED|nr:hypothetical protein [Pseudomonas gingeri]NWC14745.1 hypothetical protein [Pseudomonas gingeri]PNQ93154.1 hypothetical protein CCU68_07760 [Pseudomonas gingeri NCPPB 3146 = LMG 5327]